MGCDIHPHIEVKVKGKWLHYSCPLIDRWYALFEKIAGVRGDVRNALAPPRGLPSDISEVTRICWTDEGGHTPTWLSSNEIEELCRWTDFFGEWRGQWQHKHLGYLCGNGFTYRPDGIDDVRLVCWFDN